MEVRDLPLGAVIDAETGKTSSVPDMEDRKAHWPTLSDMPN